MAQSSKRGLAVLATVAAACGVTDTRDSAPEPEPLAIHSWLASGEYLNFRHESAAQPGLNGTTFRVFLNDRVHPEGSSIGAVGVRELYVGSGTKAEHVGWSTLVKVGGGNTPEDWFFYETFELEQADAFAVAEPAAPGCTSCHRVAADVIRSHPPFE